MVLKIHISIMLNNKKLTIIYFSIALFYFYIIKINDNKTIQI